jgi:hypothetical protein
MEGLFGSRNHWQWAGKKESVKMIEVHKYIKIE